MKILRILPVFLLSLVLMGFSGCEKKKLLDPSNPVEITVWHYYNGLQQAGFDEQVALFNATKGKDLGIYVEGISKGSVSDLEKALRESAAGLVGADDLPEIFSSYADTAYSVQKENLLTDLRLYFSEAELSQYVQDYLAEGSWGNDGALYLLPVAKSTEVFLMNKTDWEPFAEATGASLDNLSTVEGITETARAYYEWTDSLTPDIPEDGKAFYGRDAMANYMILGMKQMGIEFLDEKDGRLLMNADKASLRRLWDNYYVPLINGYFAEFGRFRSDDVKTGDILAYTGSSSSVSYFPDWVDDGDSTHDIEFTILNAPVMKGGKRLLVLQGAGMAITKTDEKHEYAASVFLKWFTEPEHNIAFSVRSSYLPVRKVANQMKVINDVVAKEQLKINPKTAASVQCIMDSFDSSEFYSPKNFENAYAVRNVVNKSLSNKAKKDRITVLEMMQEGVPRKKAVSDFDTDENFESWYENLCSEIQNAADK